MLLLKMNRGKESIEEKAKTSRAIPKSVEKILFAKSAGRCAKCNEKYYSENDEGFTTFYRVCHIHGVSEKSARHNPDLDSKDVNDYPNLILMCANCHDEIDGRPDLYTVESLIEMKKKHEQNIEDRVSQRWIYTLSGPAGENISAIPSCLRTFSQVVTKTDPNPAHMRIGKPAFVDFESGTVVRRDNEMDAIEESLFLGDLTRKLATSIITGDSGTGKTVLGLHVGFELEAKGWLVLYVDAEIINIDGRDQQIVDYLRQVNSNTLLIIDNVNGSQETVCNIIQGLERVVEGSAILRLLLTGRLLRFAGNPIRTSIEQILTLSDEVAIDVEFDLIKKIAKSMSIDVGNSRETLEKIVEYTGSNLPLAGTALQQYSETRSVRWEELADFALNRKLRNLEFTHRKLGETILLIIAIFTRMHCTVSYRFLLKILSEFLLPDSMDILEELIRQGHIVSRMMGREVLLSIDHPSIANLLLNYFGKEVFESACKRQLKSEVEFGLFETQLWIDYCKFPPPDLPLYLVNLTTGLFHHYRVAPALKLLEVIEEDIMSDSRLSIGLTNIGVILYASGYLLKSRKAYELALHLDSTSGFTWANYGNLMFSLNELQDSIDAYERACALLPDVGFIPSQLGNVLTEIREFDLAETSHKKAIELEPNDPLIWSNFGAHYADRNMLQESIQAFGNATSIQDSWIDAWIGLSKVYMRQKKMKSARKSIAKAWSIEPKGFYHLLDLAALLAIVGKIDYSEESIKRALDIYPNSGEAILVLSEVLVQANRLPELLDYYNEAPPIESSDPGTIVSIGTRFEEIGNPEISLKLYLSALEINPEFGDALFRIALHHSKKGDLDTAEEFYLRAIEVKYEIEDIYCNWAIWLSRFGNLKKAIYIIDEFLKDNESSNGWFLLGRFKTENNEIDGAIEAYRTAAKINESYYQAWYNLGNCFVRKKQLENAEIAYRKAIEVNQNYTKGRIMLAQILHWTGRSEQGLQELRRAAKISPNDPTIILNLAHALQAMGYESEAKKYAKIGSELSQTERKETQDFFDQELGRLFASDEE